MRSPGIVVDGASVLGRTDGGCCAAWCRGGQVNARLERAHHPPCRCVEHLVGDMIQQISFEPEVDDEVDLGSIRDLREGLAVRQLLQRPINGAHQPLSWPVRCHLAREALSEEAEPHD
jgi:hypothetical protein